MALNKEQTLKFIDEYRQLPELWQSNNPNYRDRRKRKDALRYLCEKYNSDTKNILNKIKSLRSYFHREHSRIKKMNCRDVTDDMESNWFAYKSMQFVMETTSRSKNNETNKIEELFELMKEETGMENGCHLDTSSSTTGIPVAAEIILEELPSTHKPTYFEQKRRNEVIEDETDEFLREEKPYLQRRDEFSAFGEYIAEKLRKLSSKRLQAVAQNKLNNLLFQIEMESLNEESAS